jgi:signal transduction histidine kinase
MDTIQQDILKAHFFDLSLDLLCILDLEGKIMFANTAFMTEIQQRPEMSFIELVHADDRESVLSAFTAFRRDVSPTSFACRFHCFDETTRWYLWTLYPQVEDCVHAVGKDITPYKEMEAKEVERNIFAEALLDTALAINSSLALNQVLERILSNVGKVVAYEYVCILLVDGDEVEVVGLQNGHSLREDMHELKGRRFPIHHNDTLQHMFQTHESHIIPELEQSPAWIVASEMASAGSFLGSPIIVDDQVIGFLCVLNSKKEFFTPLHAQQLITLANQAGIAINNARLFEQAQSAAVLRERQRMAQELHDAVNQDLFAASTYADLLPKAIEQKPQAVAGYAIKISKLVRSAVDQMRMILIELQPDTLTNTGLEVLLQQLCDVLSRQISIPIKFTANTKLIFEEKVQIAIYRIAQEALHNINKHANATHVEVTLLTADDDLQLTIKDNGIGFDQNSMSEVQFGIRGMKERAQGINADLLLQSQVGLGTKIILRIQNYDDYKTHPHHPRGRSSSRSSSTG